MEWVPLKYLFGNASDSIVKLMISITSGVSFWYRPSYKNMLNYESENVQYNSRFSLTVELIIQVFSLSTNLVREVNNSLPDFKRIP